MKLPVTTVIFVVAVTAAASSCVDRTSCKKIKSPKDAHCEKERVKSECPVACGICVSQTIITAAPCVDRTVHCEEIKKLTDDEAKEKRCKEEKSKQLCPVLCGICTPSTTATTTAQPCVDSTEHCEAIKGLKDVEEKEKRCKEKKSQDLCPKLCGKCGL